METIREILTRMQETYEAESGHSAEDVSDTGLRLRVMAGELLRLQAEIAWLRRQTFPQTAEGEWLDRHAAMRGVTRRPAAKAQGSLTFSRYLPLSFDLIIPAGTVCASTGEDPVEVETTAEAVLPAGELTVTVPAQAVLGGPEGNLSAGSVNTMIDPPTGLNYVNNSAPFTGGREAETDGELRSRVLLAYSLLPNAANAAFYRDLALSVEGVGFVGVVPREKGAGTVGVYIWGTEGAPSEELIAAVQQKLDEAREIAVTVTVQAATASTENVAVRLKLENGADMDHAKAAVAQALQEWFAGRTVGSSMYLTELERVILNAAPVVRLEWPITMMNAVPRADRIPVLGSIRVEVLS